MEAAARAPQDEPAAAARRPAEEIEARPNGPVAAALLATGIGSLVLAILVVAAEASESFAESLMYSDRVGALSGKTIWAVVAYLGSWLGLAAVLRNRTVDLQRVAVVAGILVALALIGTFSPFFQLFKPD